MNTAIIPVIVEQHAEEAAFLWILRDAAVKAPHYRLKDLAKLDGRVEAHLDGLRIAGSEGWRICADALQTGESGEAFAAGVLALESRDRQRLEAVLQAVEKSPESARGLISAFGWVAPQHLSGVVKTLLDSPSPLHRLIGIRACGIHRADPGPSLSEVISQPGQPQELLAAALRTAGELRHRDLWPAVRQHLQSPEVAVRFWAAWASVLLGDRGEGVESLKAMVVTEFAFQLLALGLALRVMPLESAQQWLKGFSQYQQWQHQLVIGVGILGDPAYVPWLIKQMENLPLARAAGEALSLITGVDIAYEDLDGDKPENFESGPTENPEDDAVAMDDEENLPWPDPKKVANWWQQTKSRFAPGVRHLAGAPVTESQCRRILAEGYQRQRNAAAMELALILRDQPLFETRAPGWRQHDTSSQRRSDAVQRSPG